MTLYRGDAYRAADGDPLDFVDVLGTWPDLSGATVVLEWLAGGQVVLSKAGLVLVPSGAGKAVRAEPTSADTSKLTLAYYQYRYVATLADGDVRTLPGAVGACLVS